MRRDKADNLWKEHHPIDVNVKQKRHTRSADWILPEASKPSITIETQMLNWKIKSKFRSLFGILASMNAHSMQEQR